MLSAKKLLQDLCRKESLGWNDEAPEEYRRRWAKWRSKLPLLEQLHVDRCLKPPHFGQVVSKQIHLFSDASSMGYGSVAYMKSRSLLLPDGKGPPNANQNSHYSTSITHCRHSFCPYFLSILVEYSCSLFITLVRFKKKRRC